MQGYCRRLGCSADTLETNPSIQAIASGCNSNGSGRLSVGPRENWLERDVTQGSIQVGAAVLSRIRATIRTKSKEGDCSIKHYE